MKTIRLEPVKWCACNKGPIAAGFTACRQCVSDGERATVRSDFIFQECVSIGVPQPTRKLNDNELRG